MSTRKPKTGGRMSQSAKNALANAKTLLLEGRELRRALTKRLEPITRFPRRL